MLNSTRTTAEQDAIPNTRTPGVSGGCVSGGYPVNRPHRSLDVLVLSMYYAPESSGNAPYATGMAHALAAEGHRVRVVAGYPHYPQWRIADGYGGLRLSEVDAGGVPVTRVRHPVPASPTAGRRVAMDVVFSLHAAGVGGARPDVVIAVSPTLLTVAAGLRWRSPGRTALGVVTQDLYSRALSETGMASPRRARAAARLERALLDRADGIVSVHENFVRSLRRLGVGNPPISVIRNWSHVGQARSSRDRARRRLGWRPGEVIALHAGNMGMKQGLENVVAAAREADARAADVRFVLLGDGGCRPRLERAAAGIDRLSFLDPLPDGAFEDAVAAADVLVLNEAPSVVEMSAPSKLTTYFAAGRPVVAATDPRSAAHSEIRRSGGGECVPPGNPTALFEAVASMGHDRSRADAAGRRGRRYAEAHLTPESARRAYCRWVEELAASRHRYPAGRVPAAGSPSSARVP